MRTTIASTLILIAVCLAIFAAKPANLDRKARSVGAQRRDSLPTLGDPRSPIRHLIVVVGENLRYDNVFDTYVPSRSQLIWDPLTQASAYNNRDPAPNDALPAQEHAADTT